MDSKAEATTVMWALVKLMKTQKAVAHALGQSKQVFNYWLNHANKVPLDQLQAMKQLLEKSNVSCKPDAVHTSPLHEKSVLLEDITLSQQAELGMLYEMLLGSRKGQRNDLNPATSLSNLDQVPFTWDDFIHQAICSQKQGLITVAIHRMLQFMQVTRMQPRLNLDEVMVQEWETERALTQLRALWKTFFIAVLKSIKKKYRNACGRTDRLVAKLSGFNSKDTYRFVKKVILLGCDSLIQAMNREDIPISLAHQLARLSVDEQEQLLAEDKKAIAAHLKQIKETPCPETAAKHIMRLLNLSIYQEKALLEAEEKYRLPLRAALVSLIISCCDECGGFEWEPEKLKHQALPYLDIDFEILLEALRKSGLVKKKTCRGKTHGCIPLAKRFIHEVHDASLG